MMFSNQMPHMKCVAVKIGFPLEPTSERPNLIILNSKSEGSFENLIKSGRFMYYRKYLHYYLDGIYKGKIGSTPQYRFNFKQRRKEYYKTLKTNLKFVHPVMQIEQMNNYKGTFDLFIYNEIFFNKIKKIPVRRRPALYLNYLNNILNRADLESRGKVLLINLDEWQPNVKKFNDPIAFIYYSLRKEKELFQSLGNIDIIIFNSKKSFRINPSQCTDKNDFRIFKRELNKLKAGIIPLEEDEEKFEAEIEKAEEINSLVQSKLVSLKNFAGPQMIDEETENKVNEEIENAIDKKIEETKIDDNDTEAISSIIDEVKRDKKTIEKVFDIIESKKNPRSNASLARDEELRKKQKEMKISNIGTVDEIENLVMKADAPILEVNDVSDKVNTINKNITKVRFKSFNKLYNKNLYEADIMNAFTSLSRKSLPVYIIDYTIEDTSDLMNYKNTYTIKLEDANRVRHTIKVDMPKFIDDDYMYLGGNEKQFVKQLSNKPVVKTGPDTVQICSATYNKIFIHRLGEKLTPGLTKFKKLLTTNPKGIIVKYGACTADNAGIKSDLIYDELGKSYKEIIIDNKQRGEKIHFIFSQKDIKEHLKGGERGLPVGYIVGNGGKRIITVDPDSNEFEEVFLNSFPDDLRDQVNSLSAGKKFTYSIAIIMKKKVPIIFLLGFFEGLTTILKKAGIKFQFSDKKPVGPSRSSDISIKFKDGYLNCEAKTPAQQFLLNAFSTIKTEGYNSDEFEGKDVYLEIFENIYGMRNVAMAFMNFYESMIDPITFSILNKLNYPTTFTELVLFANNLLSDNDFMKENNMNMYRIRANEVAAAILYKHVAMAYGRYLSTASTNKPNKISVKRDAVLKDIKLLKTVEDKSRLNYIYELEKTRACTPKGWIGLNIEDAYTLDKRSYDPTMLGILGMSTSPDANAGVVRELTLEPNIKDVRGFVDIKDDKLDELKDANLFTAAEMCTPVGAARDEGIRTAMASKQSKHIVPTVHSDPVLISNGTEQVVPYHLSSDFSIIAEQDGVVIERDDDAGLVVVKYNDGSIKAIDISVKTVKNGAGGFYLSGKLRCNLKVGDKVEKNDILAVDDKFFADDLFGIRATLGTFAKVACAASDSTFEDSSMITKKLSEKMAAEIEKPYVVVLGKNANVDYMVKVGDKVKVGDELITFEQAMEESTLNDFLSSIGEELQEDIRSLGKTKIKSHATGEVVDIKIYAGSDPEEMSPSLRKIVKDYYAQINKRKKILDKYDTEHSSLVKCGILFNEPTSKIVDDFGKIQGEQVDDGVLIKIFVKIKNYLGVADKITFYGPLKTTVGRMIPEGQEMWSELRPNEEVSTEVAPNSVIQRMVPGVVMTGLGNKVLVEGTRKAISIWKNVDWKDVL